MTEQANVNRTAWNCRWSQPDYRRSAVADPSRSADLWVCVRIFGVRRFVGDGECSRCPFWEPNYTRAN